METYVEASLMRIFISNTDKFKHAPLYEMIVFAAKRYGLAGATVLKGTMGFGSSSVVRSSKFWEITEKLPVVIEIVDETQNIDAFAEKIIPWFEKLRYGCMITVEKVNIVYYKNAERRGYFDN
jgi:PII-like signaling protein